MALRPKSGTRRIPSAKELKESKEMLEQKDKQGVGSIDSLNINMGALPNTIDLIQNQEHQQVQILAQQMNINDSYQAQE